jgi:5-hydroxyisourate hydrolase
MARISTHVLNTALGKPAAGIPIEIYHGPALLTTTRTNADGRTDKPLVEREELDHGTYTLVFHVHDYLRSTDGSCGPFFETIRIQFIVTNGNENYHVPLLLSPYAYSTYRGS